MEQSHSVADKFGVVRQKSVYQVAFDVHGAPIPGAVERLNRAIREGLHLYVVESCGARFVVAAASLAKAIKVADMRAHPAEHWMNHQKSRGRICSRRRLQELIPPVDEPKIRP